MTVVLLVGATFAALNTINNAYRGDWLMAAFQALLFVILFVWFRSENRRAVR